MKNEILKPKNSTIINSELLTDVHNSIVYIRNIPVITDADVAALYEVETKRINEAVKNNPVKFPEIFLFVLNGIETNIFEVEIFDLKNETRGGRRNNPRVFTEQGIAMLATILKTRLQ